MLCRAPVLAALATLSVLLTGCTTASTSDPSQGFSARTPGVVASDGPASSSGTFAPTGAPAPGSARAAEPSAAALMVCGEETRTAVTTLLALPAPPVTRSTWADSRFTCTYHLAQGALVLAVQEAGTPAAAEGYFAALRQRSPSSSPLSGVQSLGLPAFATATGQVAFVKDDKVLDVDASGLPPSVGAPPRDRAELAYALASDVLGCWTAH